MKIMLDVNVVVDILGKTEDFRYSFQALDIMLIRQFEPCMAVSAAPIVHYVLTARKYASRNNSLDSLESFSDLISLLDVTEADYRQAIELSFSDFEDGMLASCAKRHGVDLIVTRNVKDFKAYPVAVMTPQQFCEAYIPADYQYDFVELD